MDEEGARHGHDAVYVLALFNGHFDDFFVWCITEWHAISVKELGWMKARPEVPSLVVLHQFLDKFLSVWIVRDRLKQASRFDIDEVTELRLKGTATTRPSRRSSIAR